MALEFNPPNLPGLQFRNTIPQSIDDLFNQYRQSQFQQQQLSMAQQEQATKQAEFSSNNMGLTPERFNAALPAAQDGFTGPSAGNPDTATVQAILAMHQRAQSMGAAQAQAGLGKTQAEAAKAESEGRLAGAKADLFTGGPGGKNMFDEAAQNVKAGKWSPEQAATFAGRGEEARMALMRSLINANVPVQQLQNIASAQEALAKGGAIPIANTGTLQSSLNVLDELNNEAPRNSIQTINKYGLQLAAERGDRYANRLLQQAKVASDLFQNNFGQGSNEKLALAQELSNPKQTTKQLADTIALMRADMKNRVSAFKGQPGTEKPTFNDNHSANGIPKAGDIMDGYKFKGGDPSNKDNWEEQP